MATKLVIYTGGSRAKMTGSVTGNVYWFPKGQAVPVDTKDIPAMLAEERKTGCCGSGRNRTKTIFALAE